MNAAKCRLGSIEGAWLIESPPSPPSTIVFSALFFTPFDHCFMQTQHTLTDFREHQPTSPADADVSFDQSKTKKKLILRYGLIRKRRKKAFPALTI